MKMKMKVYRGRAYNGVIVLPVTFPVEMNGDVVMMELKDFYELLGLVDDHDPDMAQEIRAGLDPELTI